MSKQKEPLTYKIFGDKVTWLQAAMTCKAEYAELASMADYESLMAIRKATTNYEKGIKKLRKNKYWVGATDKK